MQNSEKCDVYIWDTLVGEMIIIAEKVYFKYDSNFTLEISPLELGIRKKEYSFENLEFQHNIAGVFADSLPDSYGMKIINNYFDKRDVKFKPNVIDRLLFIGEVSLGALNYKPSIEAIGNKNVAIEIRDVKKLEKDILNGSYVSIRAAIDKYISFSPAGGAKEKMIINYNESSNSFSLGKGKKEEIALILKIDESDKPYYGVAASIEYVYSLLAKECGIDMPDAYLFEDGKGYKHFAIQRFDLDLKRNKLHTHTLSGLLNTEKSQRIDYANILMLMKSYLFLPHEDIEELYRRMVFNYVYNNFDDHLKNFTFLMDKKGKWRLSPAYDLTYNNSYAQRVMMLSINNKLSDEVSMEDFKMIAEKYNIANYKEIISKVENSYDFFAKNINKYLNDDKFKYDKMEVLEINKIRDIIKS